MTQEELDALPDVTPRIGRKTMWVKDRFVTTPVFLGKPPGAMFHGPDDGMFTCQRTGTTWLVGQIDGRRVKRLSTV